MTTLCPTIHNPVVFPGLDPAVPTLGELVIDLRTARGLTQRGLAERVGCDPETIGRVEQGRGPGWSRRTARSVFEALAAEMPLTMAEAREFLNLGRLGESLLRPPFVQSRIDQDIEAEDRGEPVPSDPTSVEMREVHRALKRLLDALGPTGATRLMDAVADGRNAVAPSHAPPTARQVTVVEPHRVPFPGAIEQVHRTYEVTTPKPQPKPKAKPKKRTG